MATNEVNTIFDRAEANDETQVKGLLRDTVDDGVVVNHIPAKQNITKALPATVEVIPNQDLKDFLARPSFVMGGVFNSTSPLLLESQDCYVPITASTIYQEKLNGFGGLRADVKVTVQVNGQKFQQGLLILAYIPCYFENSAREAVRITDYRLITQLPHVELDISCDTEATLEIPYIHPKTYYDWTTGSPGTWFLFTYSPVNSGSGSLNCNYTVWISYHNVQLFAPTARRVILQAGPEEDDKPPSASKILRLASNTFTEISKVPLLNSVSTPLAWATGIASKGLAAMGWSKPTDTRPITLVQAQTATNVLNADGPTPVMPIGMMATNQVAKMDSIGYTGLDEMAFSYIAQKRAFFDIFTWADTNTADSLLWSYPVHPMAATTTTGDITMAAPVAGILRPFLFWRGTLRYRFKVVKTEMHSGRLMVSFIPGSSAVAETALGKSAYLLRNIIDLRDGSDFTIEVPFIYPKQWAERGVSIGTLAIRVVNTLRAPSTCAQSVKVLCEISGGPDYKVAVPSGDVTPATYLTGGMMALKVGSEESPPAPAVELQAGEDDPCEAYVGGIGGARSVDNLAPSLYCIGEEIQSVKQVVSTISWFKVKSDVAAMIMSPFAWGSRTPLVVSDVADPMSYWASMFAFSRGSVDLHVLPKTDTVVQFQYLPRWTDFPYWSSNTIVGDNLWRLSAESTTKKRVIQLRAPQYMAMPFRVNYLYSPFDTGLAVKEFEPRGTIRLRFMDAVQTKLYIGRSGGDDFQFHFFLGVYPYSELGVNSG